VAVDELHGDVVPPVDLVEVEDVHDVGVGEPRGEARLLDEHPHEVARGAVVAADELEGDLLHEPGRARHLGPEDLGHPARRDGLEESVLSDLAHRWPIVSDRRASR
jgi:hypothetical protein